MRTLTQLLTVPMAWAAVRVTTSELSPQRTLLAGSMFRSRLRPVCVSSPISLHPLCSVCREYPRSHTKTYQLTLPQPRVRLRMLAHCHLMVSARSVSGLTLNSANGFPGSILGPLDFHVLASGLTTASFIAGTGSPTGNPLFFALDVGIGCTATACANTGFAGATSGTSPVPLPPAALLFGTALVGMTVLGRRRKQSKITS